MVYDVRHGGAFQRFLADAKAGRKIEIWGSETTRWPLIESTDLARAYCDLLERPDLGGHFNVSAEDGVTVGRIASVIAQAHGSPTSPIIRSVEDAMKEHGEWAKGPTLDQQMSAQKVQRTVGWQPNFTDFAEPISRWIAGSEV
jgi:nucleoside-diphosphate-sugar epimerase